MSSSEGKIYTCEYCEDKTFKSHSGHWKHMKNHHSGLEATKVVEPVSKDPEPTFDPFTTNTDQLSDEESQSTDPEWLSYSSPESTESDYEEEVTEKSIPTALKFAAKTASAPAKVFSRDMNKSLLLMIYGATDSVLSTYASAVTNGEIKSIVHSADQKDFTAEITLDWMQSSEIDLTNHLTPGLLAFGVNAYYVGNPVVKIQKKSKVEMGAKVGSIASKIPILGKWLAKRSKKDVPVSVFGQNPKKFTMEGEEL